MQLNFHTFNVRGFWDKTGAAVSWVCAVHCLAIPLIVSSFPLLGLSFLAGEAVEYVFIGLSVVIAAVSLLPAYFKSHRKIRAVLLFTSGIGFMIFSDILFEDDLTGKIVFVSVGAICITLAHFINRHLCKTCRNCDEPDAVHCHN
jgi:hypothetical protein